MDVTFSEREQNWLVRYSWDNKLSTAAVVRMAVRAYMETHETPSATPTNSPVSEESNHG